MNRFAIRNFSILILFCFVFIQFSEINAQKKKITIEDIWAKYSFNPGYINDIKSMKNGEDYTVLEDGMINQYSYSTGNKIKTVFSTEITNSNQNISIEDYEFSPDETKILIITGMKPIYRYSFSAKYFLWDIKNQKLISLSERDNQRLASFSPDSRKIAFVSDNNIFIKNIDGGDEFQVTNDGKKNEIINGSSDWVYEEELELVKAYEWSPDSKKIAYLRFDESQVKQFSLTIFDSLYPQQYLYKYPKAGENNSIVELYIYNIESRNKAKINTGENIDIYIPRIKWTNDDNFLSYSILNRKQNRLQIMLCDVNNFQQKKIYDEENNFYIEINNNLIFLKNNKQFIITNETSGYNHIYLYNMSGKLLNSITKGKWNVFDIKGIDEDNNIYYSSNEESVMERDVYSININGENKKKLTEENGFNDTDFSSNFKYFIQTNSTAENPPVYLMKNIKGKIITTIEDNALLVKRLSDYGFSKKEFLSIYNSSGIQLYCSMIKPPDFKPDKKYPLLINVYGGPGVQMVLNKWNTFENAWHQMLAQMGYIVVSIDNRGTPGRDEFFKKCTYLQLGNLEIQDQVDAAKHFASLDYIDASRIGIWGWSYGGYMTCLALTKGADVFKTGIAVAPVTNWKFYDNVYTERYMRTPQENSQGYEDNSPINYANKLKGKLLIVHGLADDNVHFQNTAEFIKSLIKANKKFDTFFYPDKNHFLSGSNTRLHLYSMMTEYILKNL